MRGIIVLGLVLMSLAAWSQEGALPGKTETKEAYKTWGKEIVFEPVEIPEEIQGDSGIVTEFDQVVLVRSASEISGYLLLTSALGRFDYFDYCIFYSDELKVLKVLVTKYRSTRGAAICSKGWLKQFEGYDGGPIRVGEEINAISGATISANSIVRDIERGYRLMTLLVSL